MCRGPWLQTLQGPLRAHSVLPLNPRRQAGHGPAKSDKVVNTVLYCRTCSLMPGGRLACDSKGVRSMTPVGDRIREDLSLVSTRTDCSVVGSRREGIKLA